MEYVTTQNFTRCAFKQYKNNYQIHFLAINRGSYMSAHVILNLLNELGKRDKMRGLSSILSLFHEVI